MSGSDGTPVLRILRGGVPDDSELAAIVVAIAAASGGPTEPGVGSGSDDRRWAYPASLVRPAVHPTGWWASGLPR